MVKRRSELASSNAAFFHVAKNFVCIEEAVPGVLFGPQSIDHKSADSSWIVDLHFNCRFQVLIWKNAVINLEETYYIIFILPLVFFAKDVRVVQDFRK